MEIKVVGGPDEGSAVEIVEGVATIGRDESSTLVLTDKQASSHHAAIEVMENGSVVLRDLHSTNGTFIGGSRVEGDVPLSSDDEIKIGRNVLKLAGAPAGKTVIAPARAASSVSPRATTAAPRAGRPAESPPASPPRRAVPSEFFSPGGLGSAAATKERPRGRLVGAGLAAAVVVAAIAAVILFVAPGVLKSKSKSKSSHAALVRLSEVQVVAKASKYVIQIAGAEGNSGSYGSGIIVNLKRGLALTNAHVISGTSALMVRFNNGQTSPARVVAEAPCDDVALISISNVPTSGVSQATLSTTSLVNGQHVTTLGYPGTFADIGTEHIISTDGSVSAPTESAEPDPGLPNYSSIVQHTAIVNPGNSGGPLVDDYGRVVGMNTLNNTVEGGNAVTGRIVQGQYYAISAAELQQDLPGLSAGKSKSYVGWKLAPLSEVDLGNYFTQAHLASRSVGEEVQAYLESHGTNGLIIQGVDPGSVAASDGYARGSLISSIDGTPVTTVGQVCDILNSHGPGDTLSVNGIYITSGGVSNFNHKWTQSTVLR